MLSPEPFHNTAGALGWDWHTPVFLGTSVRCKSWQTHAIYARVLYPPQPSSPSCVKLLLSSSAQSWNSPDESPVPLASTEVEVSNAECLWLGSVDIFRDLSDGLLFIFFCKCGHLFRCFKKKKKEFYGPEFHKWLVGFLFGEGKEVPKLRCPKSIEKIEPL